jgi:hypothetical protein
MSWRIHDLVDREKTFKVNAWNWRPTLEILKTFGILDEDRLERMQYNVTVTVSLEEARGIAEQFERRFLSKMTPADRVRLDLTLTDEPDDFQIHDDDLKNYGATEEWLQKFTDFCRSCNGFEIG